MMPDGVIAELFAIVFLHVFPQCSVGIQVGHASIYTGNDRQVSAELLYRTIDRVGDKPYWTEIEERPERDLALEQRILAFHSRRYPQTKIFHAACLKKSPELPASALLPPPYGSCVACKIVWIDAR